MTPVHPFPAEGYHSHSPVITRSSRVQTSCFRNIISTPNSVQVDVARPNKHNPYGNPIAIGFLTISTLTAINHSVISYDREDRGGESGFAPNHGFDKLLILAPVTLGRRIPGHCKMNSITERNPVEYLIKLNVEVEIEARDPPALIAQRLSLWFASLDNQRIVT